jgi:hypothetical protein
MGEPDNDYLRNLQIVLALDVAKKKHLGILCSAIAAYKTNTEPRAPRKQLSHVGIVGERSSFNLKVVDLKYWANNFGMTTATKQVIR